MEFVGLSRYVKVKDPKVSPFKKLRTMKPIWLGQDLRLANDEDNIAYARSMGEKGVAVVPVRRHPPVTKYLNRETFPRRILLEMTSQCNFLCRMCPQQFMTRPRMDMPGAAYRRVIDEIDFHGLEGLWLYHLGESLLHPEFRKNIQHIQAKKNLGIIWMSTNGRYFTEDNIKTVIASNIGYVNFSAHAVTEKTYNTVAPPGNFAAVQANLEKFYELKGIENLPRKPYLHCQMIEQETTKHEVDAFIEKHYARAEIVSVNMLEYANLPNNKFGLKQRKRKPLNSCLRVARNDCFIFSNGDVTLCDAAFNGEIYLGNIHKESLRDIWSGPRRKEILKLNKEGRMAEIEFCVGCTDYDI